MIIPERRYIVNSLEDAKMVIDKYKVQGVCINLIKDGGGKHE